MTQKSEVDLLLEKTNVGKVQVYDKEGNVVKTLTEEEIKSTTQEVLDYMLDSARKYKDFGQLTNVLKNLIELKKAYWPSTQVNKNLNINVFDAQLEKWQKARQELKKLEKQYPVEYEIVNSKPVEVTQ